MNRQKFLFTLGVSAAFSFLGSNTVMASVPDSAYVFSYCSGKNHGKNGLHFAWSVDNNYWQEIGPEYSFIKSDYGTWGREKRMVSPYLMRDEETKKWHCIWSVNEHDNTFAYATSTNLTDWKPQSYPSMDVKSCVLNPVLSKDGNNFKISYIDNQDKYYAVQTGDFKSYSNNKSVSSSDHKDKSVEVEINGVKQKGQIHRVEWSVVDNLIKTKEYKEYKNRLHDERCEQDPVRFANLGEVKASLKLNRENSKEISDLLIGAFFEDINYAADGGLYAELIQNRGFEYDPSDRRGDKNWNSKHSWHIIGEGTSFEISQENPIHENNKNYAVLNVSTPGASLENHGFDGIVVRKGDKYDFSAFGKTLDGKGSKYIVRLINGDGETLAQTTLSMNKEWKKQVGVLKSNADANDAKLQIQPLTAGEYAFDMVSLFPQKTFKGRKNGLRQDLAQIIADMKPRFVRFPGGCVAHGDGLHNIYNWKKTIGKLEERTPARNLWGYHQSMGLGYYEYFLFCEDMGAEPLPVLAAGVCCQNSSDGGAGQQGGIPMCEMNDYIQDVLDLIEWANGDAKTTKWGKVRASNGHPKPFGLKYIGIGNEDLISDVFEERFVMINNAVKEKYPEIKVVGTAGPFYEGSDYEEGWRLATEHKVDLIDEHYYVSPGWFIYNQDYYDKYDRNRSKVYLGEYASHLPGRHRNLETALSEALYLTSVERNGDVVAMTSYAPLLAKDRFTQWNPDLIYFNNHEIRPTVGYYVQKLYGNNSGDKYVYGNLNVNTHRDDVRKRVASSVVTDSKTGDMIIKLVNMLPVGVDAELDLGDISGYSKDAKLSLLSGDPKDSDLKPIESVTQVSDKFSYKLPAYSFSVIRITKEVVKKK